MLTEAERASLACVRSWREQVNAQAGQSDSPRIIGVLVQELEQLKEALTARQIELTAQAVHAARARCTPEQKASGWAERITGAEIAFARRRHPIAGSRLVRQALTLTESMPAVVDAMRDGVLGETQAAILVRETDGLTDAQRTRASEELRGQWSQLGDRRLADVTRRVVSRIDPDLADAKATAAARGRHVSWRSAPDSMLRLTALLPAKEGLACVQALQSAAAESMAEARAAANGPAQRREVEQDQVRAQADELVARLTGRSTAQEQGVDVRVNLMIPIDSLTGDTAGHLEGYGPITASVARQLIEACPDENGPQIRRIFTAPGSGDLVGMESTSRTYRGLLRQFIRLRDQRCRTPFCESPIRQIDHIKPVAAGGATTARQGRGTCARCNYTKELPGYVVTGDAHDMQVRVGSVTRTSIPPPSPGALEQELVSPLERRFVDIIWGGFTTPVRE